MNLIYGTTNCYDKMILDRKRKQANESASQAGQCIEPSEVSNRIVELQKAMPTASALTWYNTLTVNGVSSFSKQELHIICEQIRKLDEYRAMVIYWAYTEGWWDQDTKATCEEIRKAPDGRAEAIFRARCAGWWDQTDAETCEAIRQANGNRAWAIFSAKQAGWWDQDDADTCAEIRKAPGDSAWTICRAKHDGWWVEPEEK